MNEISHKKFGLGASVLRREDDAFITGKGAYTDDTAPENTLIGYVLRSPYAHATFKITDLSAAKEHPGVHGILVAADVSHVKPIPCQAPAKQPDGSKSRNRDIPILCDGVVRHVGDAIAFIIADHIDTAKDAAELIEIDFHMKEAVVDTAKALHDDAAHVYDDGDGNLAFTHETGDRNATQKAFEDAHRVVEMDIVNNRLVANYIEPRSCHCVFDESAGRYEMMVASQGVFGHRRTLANLFGLKPEELRVRTKDVGGGFGTKIFVYREYALCMAAAKTLGRPVKWTSDRNEHFVSDAHGRDNIAKAKMALDKDGRFLAIDIDLLAAMGAYLHTYGPLIPTLGISMTTGVYDIPSIAVRIRGVYTHTVPIDAYRGAGRPEAAYLIERLVDKCAREMKLSREEIRRRNFIKPEQMPYTTASGRMYDTGEFAGHMEECMERADWAEFDKRSDASAKGGKLRGIGMSVYIEACAFAGSEPAFLDLKDDGTVDIRIGTQSNGQGHATAYAQIAAETLGLEVEKINLRQGDTDELDSGGGTGGSRSIPLGGPSVLRASEDLAEKIRKIASEELEASVEDIELLDGEARIVGTDRTITLADIAKAAKSDEDIKGQGVFEQNEATYPNGTHICELELDPATGTTEILSYTIVDDFGVTVNPILLEGQVHGGIAQSIGQAIKENTVYSDDGQLLSASFMDYAMPRADDVPGFNFKTRNVPSTTNEMGIKGAGEAGTIGAAPAVMNAIADALARAGYDPEIQMPVTPHKLWVKLNEAKAA